VDKYPESVKALADAGMEIGNHSDDHPHMAKLSEKEIQDEVTACSQKIEAITGTAVSLFRCPYGEYDDDVISTVNEMGLYPIQWNVERSHREERSGWGGVRGEGQRPRKSPWENRCGVDSCLL
jgi:peptidoglycan/xylan/chitin deacetylase (PgdA/CDA1 family)